MRQRFLMASSDCVLAIAASTISTVAAARLSSGRRAIRRAAAVQDVSNELKSGGAHQAVWIDAQRDVVNDLAAVNGFGNHELFVFGPGEHCRHSCRGLRSNYGRVGDIDQKPANQTAQLFERRELLPSLVRGEHGLEGIGSRENDFGESGAVLLRHLRREDIFEFVSEFAELVKAAGSRITLERMHGATHAANDFLVGRMRLELEPGFVERLQQLIRALEKDRAKLGVAIFGRPAQEFASTR